MIFEGDALVQFYVSSKLVAKCIQGNSHGVVANIPDCDIHTIAFTFRKV